jgi:hypothetical protein
MRNPWKGIGKKKCKRLFVHLTMIHLVPEFYSHTFSQSSTNHTQITKNAIYNL